MMELNEDLKEMEELRKELADYFCEDTSTFKLEDTIKIFHTFCEKFKKALDENKQRKIQEEKAEQRRKMREEQAVKRRPNSGAAFLQIFKNIFVVAKIFYIFIVTTSTFLV